MPSKTLTKGFQSIGEDLLQDPNCGVVARLDDAELSSWVSTGILPEQHQELAGPLNKMMQAGIAAVISKRGTITKGQTLILRTAARAFVRGLLLDLKIAECFDTIEPDKLSALLGQSSRLDILAYKAWSELGLDDEQADDLQSLMSKIHARQRDRKPAIVVNNVLVNSGDMGPLVIEPDQREPDVGRPGEKS